MIRAEIVAEAVSWIGTPYHHHARIKGVGVDCAQLLLEVYTNTGVIPEVHFVDYARDWHLHHSDELYAGWLDTYGHEITAAEAMPGDAVLFRFGRCFSHGGVIGYDGQIIHAYIGRGVITSTIHEEPLDGRPARYWRVL